MLAQLDANMHQAEANAATAEYVAAVHPSSAGVGIAQNAGQAAQQELVRLPAVTASLAWFFFSYSLFSLLCFFEGC